MLLSRELIASQSIVFLLMRQIRQLTSVTAQIFPAKRLFFDSQSDSIYKRRPFFQGRRFPAKRLFLLSSRLPLKAYIISSNKLSRQKSFSQAKNHATLSTKYFSSQKLEKDFTQCNDFHDDDCTLKISITCIFSNNTKHFLYKFRAKLR